jgi:DNA-binding NarL/FixJ family response regulator
MVAKKLRIFVTEDHLIVRDGLRAIIREQADMEIIGEASDGQEAIEKAPQLKPDIILMDVSMPGTSGVQATQMLSKSIPGAGILALTAHEDLECMRQMLQAGAKGYVLKRAAAAELIQAIRTVAAGGLYLDAGLGAALFQEGSQVPDVTAVSGEGSLSLREAEVLRLMAQGYSNKEIGAKLRISIKTVETYKARMMEKLGLRSRSDVVRYAFQHGLLDIT